MNACVHTYTKPQTSSTRSCGLGWRIHESVEDTKLSTNKQHSLSPRIPAVLRFLPSPTQTSFSTPICTTVERSLAASAGQHGKTAAPPANALPSPRVAGRTQPSIRACGEKRPPVHDRTGVIPLHALNSSPLDTPRQHARVSPRRRSKPHHYAAHIDAVSLAFRPRSNNAHPDAHHPRQACPLPLTPPPPPRTPTRRRRARRNPWNAGLDVAAPSPHQRLHSAHPNAPPVTARPGPAHAALHRRAPAGHSTAPRPRAWHADAMLVGHS